jgi:DNA-binding CsgD family transcriptional regulator
VEIDVIGHLISDGASNALIARRIRRSPETVKTHLRRVYERASMQGRTELAVAILRGDIMVLDQQGRRVRF